MSFETVDGTLNISCSMVMTTALAAILLLIGFWIRKKVNFLTKYCIPAPVVGGFLFMFITFAGHQSGAFAFKFDTTFQSPFMVAFFTTVGLGASLSLLKKGGILLIVYWLIAGVVSIIQNCISIGLANVTGLKYPYALLAGAISMIGGHGAAGSYGSTFTDMGYPAGITVGAAAATFGLIFGVLVGGPVAHMLIEKNHLTPDNSETLDTSVEEINAGHGEKLTSLDVLQNVTSILFCMALGTEISGWIGKLIGMSFPSYVGAMFVAMLVRNLNEQFHWYHFKFPLVDGTGDIMLNLYLSMALMSLNLYQLLDLIGPVLLIVVTQVVVLVLLSIFVVFPILGKNYDAAVMCAGLLGHGLGATPSALVNMTAVKDKYGMSRKAFMIVPIVGAFLVDIIYQPQTIAFIKFFVQDFAGWRKNRKKYAEYEEHVKEIEAKCGMLRENLADVMERDTDAFLLVSDAYALPKATDEEKAARSLAIQEGLKACTRTPLEMMELMGEAVELISSMMDGFNTNCASDLGVAALSLKAGILGAWLNIKINTGSLKDKAFAADAEARGQAVLDRAVPAADDCFARLLKMVEG